MGDEPGRQYAAILKNCTLLSCNTNVACLQSRISKNRPAFQAHDPCAKLLDYLFLFIFQREFFS
jgi:hypothetical protein